MEKLIDHAPEMEIYIIPDSQMGPEVIRANGTGWRKRMIFPLRRWFKVQASYLQLQQAGWMFEKLKPTDANIITVYILGRT